MSETISMSDSLVRIVCTECGLLFGVPQDWKRGRQSDKRTFYCPNGHTLSYTESEADRLRRELNQMKQREAMHLDDKAKLRSAFVQAEVARVEAVRISAKMAKRISRGVCPGCNRTFANVARHMSSKHMGLKCVGVSREKVAAGAAG